MNKVYRLVWNPTLGMVQLAVKWAKSPHGGIPRMRTVGSSPQHGRLTQACAAALLLSMGASALPAHATSTYTATAASDKQIRLLDTTAPTLGFWNANRQASATQLGGGDGSWSRTAQNWSNVNGSITAAMQPQPGFAIFGGTPGTVTVDDSAGSVAATGIQFIVDGYQLSGATLILVADSAGVAPVLHVGNGSGIGIGVTIGNVLAGTDGLVKTDTDSLILSGANTYSGGTSIVEGTLQVGDGGTRGSIVGDVTNNGTLAFDRSDSIGFSGSINGSGDLRQDGTGNLTLSGANAYSGGTTITQGTLQVGDGGSSGSIVGDVMNNGTLAFDRSDRVVFSGIISGSGALRQQGAGSLVLNAANSYSGPTTVSAGLLEVGDAGHPGASVGGDVTVTGGTLGGHGTIAGNVNNVGGTVVSGGSIGILTVTGDYTQSTAGTLVVETTPAPTTGTEYGQLQVGGSANLDGTLVVRVDLGASLRNTRYDLVHAQGGINGTFATSMFNPSFASYITPSISYRTNDVLLTLRPNAPAYSNGLPNSASSAVLGMEQSFDAVLGQLRDDGEGRNGVWGQYLASRGGMGQGSRYANHGGAAGVGMLVGDQVVLGAAVSGGTTLTTLTPTQVRVQPLGGFVYGIWHADSLRVAGSFGVGHLQQRVRRYLGDLGTVQQANSDGRYNGFALRADYTAKLGAINLSPYAGVDYTNSHYDAAQEQGLPLLALHYDKISQHVSHYQAGLRLSTSSRTWRPWVQVGMEGWGGDRSTTVTERLGDYSKQVSSSALPGSALSGGAGMNWHAGNWDTTLSWHGAWGSDYHGNSGTLQLRYRW